MSDHEDFIQLLKRYMAGEMTTPVLELYLAGDLQNTLDRKELFDLLSGGVIAVEMGDFTEDEMKGGVRMSPAYKRLIERRPLTMGQSVAE